MAIDKIGNDGLKGEVTTNPEFQGTEAAKMPIGTTAQRASAAQGDIRFNSTLSLMEYYDGTAWKAIDSPPTVSSVSPETFSASGTTITITGQNFQSGANVKLIDTDGTELTPDSVTLVSSSSITFDITQAMVDNEKDKFDVKVTNASGLSGTLDNILEISDGTFSFTNSATSTLYDSGRSSGFAAGGSLSGGGGESDVTISYAVTSGSLPSGGSISSSTGSVTGISAVGSDTVSNFTVTATVTDASEGTSDTYTRAFALTVKAPVITSYTSTGSGTFSVPTGTTAVDVLVVAGGGAGGGASNGSTGGGAGGLIYRPAFPVTPGGSVSYSVGAGGLGVGGPAGADNPYPSPAPAQFPHFEGKPGQDSTFGSLTAKGGGAGGSENKPNQNGVAGGSGGGASRVNDPTGGGAATQPQQPGDSGTYGFGNKGGSNVSDGSPHYSGGGGGGAGAAGGNGGASSPGGVGGNGKSYSISGSSVTYAGGGGGAPYNSGQGSTSLLGNAGSGGGGQGGGPASGDPGTNNRGGGGGGGRGAEISSMQNAGGAGGSGIVIVKY